MRGRSRRVCSSSWVLCTLLAQLLPVSGVLGQTMESPQLQELLHRLTGSFSSREQSLRDSAFSDIRLRAVRIWPERSPGFWIYLEQAEAEALDRPYRQRVYYLSTLGDGRFRVENYALPDDPLAFAGAWREAVPLGSLDPADLLPRDGCSVILAMDGAGDFVGGTVGRDCANAFSGASYATTEVRISRARIESWDRGFNHQGVQMWGSRAGGYVFERVQR